MLYLPKHFDQENLDLTKKVIEDFPLATLITANGDDPFISHIPLMLEQRNDKFYLLGHFSNQNPHFKNFESKSCTAIFHGPNAMIHPMWYTTRQVPTWNYIAVHLTGIGRLKRDFRATVGVLHKLNKMLEQRSGSPWQFHFPEDLNTEEKLLNAITGFEIEVSSINAKFKLNQNRIPADRQGVVANLSKSASAHDREVAEWMKKI